MVLQEKIKKLNGRNEIVLVDYISKTWTEYFELQSFEIQIIKFWVFEFQNLEIRLFEFHFLEIRIEKIQNFE